MICNKCQLGAFCPDVINRCNSIGQCVSESFQCPTTTARHPLMRVSCHQQSQATCYGLSSDKTAEQDGVCGWSRSQGFCAVASIGEEVENPLCAMHRSIAKCNGLGEPQPMPGIVEEVVDTLCAWNPFTNTCKDGTLESEAGDGMGFGRATFQVCNVGKVATNCPAPYCVWLHNQCVPGGPVELMKEHAAPVENKHNPYLLAGIAAGAFVVALVGTLTIARTCRSQKMGQHVPLSMGPV